MFIMASMSYRLLEFNAEYEYAIHIIIRLIFYDLSILNCELKKVRYFEKYHSDNNINCIFVFSVEF